MVKSLKYKARTMKLKKINVTNRNAESLCDGCIFQHLEECRVEGLDEFQCVEPIDDNPIVINRNFIWVIDESLKKSEDSND